MARIDRDDIRAKVVRLLEGAADAQVFDAGLHALLCSWGKESDSAGAARFIPGMGESYGVSVPVLRLVAAELAKWGRKHPDWAFALIERLWHHGSREERVVAAKMLERLGKAQWERTLETASGFVGTIRNWEECDQLGCFGLRKVVQRHPEAVLPRCAEWVQDEDRWTRRLGVVVLTSLPKGKGYLPTGDEFAVLDQVMADGAREVQDAVAWALREIGDDHPAAVADYLRRHAPGAGRSTRRIIKQAMKVLPEDDRQALLRLLEQ